MYSYKAEVGIRSDHLVAKGQEERRDRGETDEARGRGGPKLASVSDLTG